MIDLVIIGGGPAGMSAAIAAYEQGIKDILILERDDSLGGILKQCIQEIRVRSTFTVVMQNMVKMQILINYI